LQARRAQVAPPRIGQALLARAVNSPGACPADSGRAELHVAPDEALTAFGTSQVNASRSTDDNALATAVVRLSLIDHGPGFCCSSKTEKVGFEHWPLHRTRERRALTDSR
jgi:hypothetical protein